MDPQIKGIRIVSIMNNKCIQVSKQTDDYAQMFGTENNPQQIFYF